MCQISYKIFCFRALQHNLNTFIFKAVKSLDLCLKIQYNNAHVTISTSVRYAELS